MLGAIRRRRRSKRRSMQKQEETRTSNADGKSIIGGLTQPPRQRLKQRNTISLFSDPTNTVSWSPPAQARFVNTTRRLPKTPLCTPSRSSIQSFDPILRASAPGRRPILTTQVFHLPALQRRSVLPTGLGSGNRRGTCRFGIATESRRRPACKIPSLPANMPWS